MPKESSSLERLDSWKDIANYVGRDIRTVMRWEKEKGLPVHRIPGGQRQSVFAYTDELDRWLKSGPQAPDTRGTSPSSELESPHASPDPNRRKLILKRHLFGIGIAGITLAIIGASVAIFGTNTSARRIDVMGIEQLTDDTCDKLGLFTDGSRIYFSERKNGRYVLSSMSVNGGPIQTFATPSVNAELVDLNTDGTELLVLSYDGYEELRNLWIVPIGDQPPRRVGQIRCQSAAWSPRGNAIAYAVGNEIDLTADEGTSSRRLLTTESLPTGLRWSADGRFLRFNLNNPLDGSSSAWQLGLGDHYSPLATSLIRNNAITLTSEWSKSTSKGEYIALLSIKAPGAKLLLLRDGYSEGTDLGEALDINFPLGLIRAVAIDSTASRLFLLAAGVPKLDLFKVDKSSGALVPFLPELEGHFLDFSRDREWLTYVKLPDDNLWVSRADGSQAHRLDFNSQSVELPRFSPDGSQIAYMSRVPDHPWRIFIVPKSGGPPHEAAHSNNSQGAPTWSPDGKYIAYGGVECQTTHSCAIHRIEVATGRDETIPGSSGFGTARWSPDGRYIAALNPTKYELVVYDFRQKTWKVLANHINGNDLYWSHDSTYLYAILDRREKPEITRIRVSDGTTETAADLSALGMLPGDLDPWFGLTPDGSLIVTRRTTTEEIYKVTLNRQ